MTNWQPIEGWPHYEISICGHVRRSIDNKLLTLWLSDQGYALVRLNNPRRCVRVHRLVAAAFVPNPNDKPFVNHLDCNRSNNHWSNLEWCTQFENLRYADYLGRLQKDFWVGKRSPNARFSDAIAAKIRSAYAAGDKSLESIGKEYGVSKRCIGRIVSMETYNDVR